MCDSKVKATSNDAHLAIACLTRWQRVTILTIGATWLVSVLAISHAWGQASSRPCPPVSERVDEPRPTCFTATEELGRLPERPIYWHLDTYPTRAAAEAERGLRGTVVESLGKIWLFTIAEAGWRPLNGQRAAKIGPLPVSVGTRYTAVYMESIFDPGTTAPIHTHSGPEAFYTLTGGTCLETPDGVLTGNTVIVPGGPPMLLMATGTQRRRGVVLILHDSSQPATTMVHDWTPKGLCKS
jgi:quercetin dioxygenase-like cupin family protein